MVLVIFKRGSMLTEKELEVLRRRARGETQHEIARGLGISQAAVSRFETNSHKKIVEAEQLLKICKSTGVFTEEGTMGKRVLYAAEKAKKKRGDA